MASESRCYNDDRKGDRVPYLRSENPSPLRLHTQTQRNMPENFQYAVLQVVTV